MSAPLLWIIIPGVIAAILFGLQQRRMLVLITGTTVAVLLAALAWAAPIGDVVSIGNFSFELGSTLTVLGRRFVLDPNDRHTLILIYLGVAFWFAGTPAAHINRQFIPLGLAIAALLTSALAVEPFLYAALIIEIMVLVSIPLLSPLGSRPGRGIVRYLTFQTLGFPCILFTGWLMARIETSPAEIRLVVFSGLLLALGFGFLLGIFPFHTWIPMLAYESHPYAIAFMFYELPVAISLLMLGFMDRYAWLRADPGVYLLIGFVGAMMVFVGGLWAAFQAHLGRLMGYAIMVEIGISLLAIQVGLGPDGRGSALGLFFALILPRGLCLGVWAFSLVVLSRGIHAPLEKSRNLTSVELSYKNAAGLGRQFPVAAFCLLLANFSIAGLPLLVGFPVRLAILEGLAQESVAIGLVVLLGYAGLIIGGVRTMAVLITGLEDTPWQSLETRLERFLLVTGGFAILLFGILPQWFTPALARMAESFTQLGR